MANLPGLSDYAPPVAKMAQMAEMRDTWHIQIPTPLGPVHAVATDEALVLLEFDEANRVAMQTGSLHRYLTGPQHEATNPILDQTLQQLDQYFHRGLKEFTLPIRLYGTAFQEVVWNHLLQIRYGQTSTYSQVARAIENNDASRAVDRQRSLLEF